ncbi:MAG: SDR family oxidoreductase [Solirubrobacteraceae bacterium]
MTQAVENQAPVLVVGATGDLGSRVVRLLFARNKHVRALVRNIDSPSDMPSNVQRAQGDILDPRSLEPALEGVRAVVTTATGYTDWASPNPAVDSQGNRNLIDAAARAGVQRFVFTRVLSADKAEAVAPFWQKKLTEDYLEQRRLSFLALRPGTIVGGNHDFWARDLTRGRLTSMPKPDVPISFVHINDVARCLAEAVDAPDVVPRIDIAAEPPATYRELATVFSHVLGRTVSLRAMPWPLANAMMTATGLFKPSARHFWALIRYLSSGVYVADTRTQKAVFDHVPSLEATLLRYAQDAKLVAITAASGQTATPARELA